MWGTWKKCFPAGLLPQLSWTPLSFIHHCFVFALTIVFNIATYASERFRHKLTHGFTDQEVPLDHIFID